MFVRTALIAVLAQSPGPDLPPPRTMSVGDCAEPGERTYWPASARSEAAWRVRATCRAVGASRAVCGYLDAVAARESSYRAGVRHTLGEGEDGLGVHGVSLRWHRAKWHGELDPDLCRPEVSTIVALRILRRAVTAYGARDLLDAQAVYAGRTACQDVDGRRVCRPVVTLATTRVCDRLAARGVDCRAPLRLGDVGRRLDPEAAQEVADRVRDDAALRDW